MGLNIIKRIKFDPEFRPVVLGPVIKKQEISAYAQAKRIVNRARQEVQRLRDEAKQIQADAVAEKNEERERGYQEGREEGLSEVSGRLMELDQEREKMLRDAEPQIIGMVMDIAEKVIGREIAQGAVVDVVKKAIGEAQGRRISVHIHPDDLKLIKTRQSELAAMLDQNQAMTIKEDESVTAGGCVTETEMGSVDARLETQLGAIKKALGLNG